MAVSRPLTLGGTRIEQARIEFRDGTIVSVVAAKGQRMLERFLALDPDASRLGELGLAPASSPLAGIDSFHVPALDRNAASHVAFGRPNPDCLPSQSEDAGVNSSAFHIDCMVGSPTMSVDGIHASGRVEPIMRKGEFTI